MPKVNLDVAIKELNGKEALKDGKPFMLREMIADACAMQIDAPEAQRKLQFGKLAFRLAAGKDEMEFTPEELVLMKDAVGKSCGPLVVCQAYEVIDK